MVLGCLSQVGVFGGSLLDPSNRNELGINSNKTTTPFSFSAIATTKLFATRRNPLEMLNGMVLDKEQFEAPFTSGAVFCSCLAKAKCTQWGTQSKREGSHNTSVTWKDLQENLYMHICFRLLCECHKSCELPFLKRKRPRFNTRLFVFR